MQEFHHRQHLHTDLLLSGLPAQLPPRHHLYKVSPCLSPHKQLAHIHNIFHFCSTDRIFGLIFYRYCIKTVEITTNYEQHLVLISNAIAPHDKIAPQDKNFYNNVKSVICAANKIFYSTENVCRGCDKYDFWFPRVITAEYGYFVRIDFRDLFRIEPASNDGKCAYDYLEVGQMNGESSSSRCKVQIPWPSLHAA